MFPFQLDGSKNLRAASISPTRHAQFKFQWNFDDGPYGPVAISPHQVGPSRARPRTRIFDDSIEKRYTLLPISCSNINIQSLRVANPALNSITCALTFPTGDATHTIVRSHPSPSVAQILTPGLQLGPETRSKPPHMPARLAPGPVPRTVMALPTLLFTLPSGSSVVGHYGGPRCHLRL